MKISQPVKATAEVFSFVSHRVYLAGFSEGLKPAQWLALRYFAKVNPMASTLTDFAKQVGCTKGTASRTVNHLIDRNFLRSRKNKEDKRSNFLELSPEGRILLQKDPIHLLENDLSLLEPEYLHTLQKILSQILSESLTRE